MNQTNEAPFYMVFLEGGNTPAVKHPELTVAQVEAARLAKQFNRKAYILVAAEVMTPEVRAIRTSLIPRTQMVRPRPPAFRLTKEDF